MYVFINEIYKWYRNNCQLRINSKYSWLLMEWFYRQIMCNEHWKFHGSHPLYVPLWIPFISFETTVIFLEFISKARFLMISIFSLWIICFVGNEWLILLFWTRTIAEMLNSEKKENQDLKLWLNSINLTQK